MKKCVICGYEVECTGKLLVGRCKQCKRTAHINCLDRLLLKHKFHCGDVTRPLERDGQELTSKGPVSIKPLRYQFRCLICGEETDETRLECYKAECGYGAHESCAAVLLSAKDRSMNFSQFLLLRRNSLFKAGRSWCYCWIS